VQVIGPADDLQGHPQGGAGPGDQLVGVTAVGPVGFLNSATYDDLGFYAAPLVFVDDATEDGPALDPLPGEVGDGVVGPGRVQLAAAMGPAPA
jgi:hypothetical protein